MNLTITKRRRRKREPSLKGTTWALESRERRRGEGEGHLGRGGKEKLRFVDLKNNFISSL